MSSRLCLALIACVWASLYLPRLGTPELEGEEIRRILPAQGMLESGDWIVPRIAGEVYSNKPPLINWTIAGLFVVAGDESERTARLVSALSVLGLALGGLFLLRGSLGNEGAALVGLVCLTALSMIAKGRFAEIEALYVALYGLASFLWIRLWSDGRSPWLVWTLPYFLLGLASLTKGPVHLLFWIPFLVATLRHAGEMRVILHPAHLLGWGILLAVFLPWTILNIEAVGSREDTVGNWFDELVVRGDVTRMEWGRWLTNPFKIVGGFMPWSVPLAYALWFLRRGRIVLRRGDRTDAVIHGSLVSMGLGFLLICLLPGGVPRYLMPVYPLAALVTVALYFRLPDRELGRYEVIGRHLLWVLIPTFFLATIGIAIHGRGEGLDVSVAGVVSGLILLAGVSALVFGPWRGRPVFLRTIVVLGAGGMALLHAIVPYQGDRPLFHDASREIAARAPSGGRIVIYADSAFRNRLTKHLRLLYYLREPVDGIGESGTVPADAVLLIGRHEAGAAMREKLAGRSIRSESSLEIRRVPLLLLHLEPAL